ncbi:MAG: DEAD/DEAH box helicase [Bacteroidales bacterium]|nr:DEAD/DEAH box helicase [Bacteroidales bacterium]
MAKKFIIVLRDYKNIGFVPFAFIAGDNGGKDFLIIEEPVTNIITESRPDEFTEKEKKIVSIINEYSDLNLLKRYSKKTTNTNDFFKQLDKKLIDEHLRPFIEKKILKIFSIIKEAGTEIYFKDDKTSSVYLCDRILINKQAANTIFNFERHADGTKYYLSINQQGKEMTLTDKSAILLVNNPCILILENTAYFFENLDGKKLSPFITKPYIQIPKNLESSYYNGFVLNAIKNYEVKTSGFNIQKLVPEIITELQLNCDLNLCYYFELIFLYSDIEVKASDKNEAIVKTIFSDDSYNYLKILRNSVFEKEKSEQLKNLGLVETQAGIYYFENNHNTDCEAFNIKFIELVNSNFQKIKNSGFTINSGKWTNDLYFGSIGLNIEQKKSEQENNDWFELNAVVVFFDFEIPFYKFKNNIINDIREFILPNGKKVILPLEWFTKYKTLFHFGSEVGKTTIRLQKQHLHILDQELEVKEDVMAVFEGKIKLLNKPKNINAILRPYQLEGFSWLAALKENGLGGCLADDMGLGKTLQILTFLSHIYSSGNLKPVAQQQLSIFEPIENKTDINPSLIILPVSLIYNWVSEIRKFSPNLRYHIHTGSHRENNCHNFSKYNLILSSYGIVKNDISFLKDFEFTAIILDESQAIKNPQSKNYQSVISLKAKHRFVLTGTPVENSLTDLWTQMNFINPGLIGKLSFFKKEFVIPIEKHMDKNVSEKLRSLIKPFILRRTKFEVEKDLPELHEQVLYCEMGLKQKSLYEAEKSLIRNIILGVSSTIRGTAKINIAILQGLTRLRQIANHPALIGESEEIESGKFTEVSFRLETLIKENHKVLVFSSFTSHLDLFSKYLEERGIKYSLLTGSLNAKQREKEIRIFEEDKDTGIFLISIKAGGIGLNLTTADYVFILDPWWNPAVEQQAISRAHRIGQKRKVFVYRFISPQTLEEKIQVLKDKKSELADKFINSNKPFNDFSSEDLLEIID